MLKVGVIGLGAMGQHHARLYSQLDCELVGVADARVDRACEIGAKYGVKHYCDYHELLPLVDAVSVVVPTTLHYRVALDFLRAGVHCLVEKPIAFDLDEAEEMVQTAGENNVNLAIGHIEQFNPAVVKLKEMVDSGALGRLLIVSTRRVGPFVPRIRDVGVVIDSATHDIGVLQYLLGREPKSIFSKVGSLRHEKEDHAVIVLDFGETMACVEVNWFTPHKVRTLVATGSEATAYLDYIEQTITLQNLHEVQVADIKKDEPLKLELMDFIRSIQEGRPPSVDGKEGLEILRVAINASRNSYVAAPALV